MGGNREKEGVRMFKQKQEVSKQIKRRKLVSVEFAPEECVYIHELERHGRILEVSISKNDVSLYRVAYWNNGDYCSAWLPAEELKEAKI